MIIIYFISFLCVLLLLHGYINEKRELNKLVCKCNHCTRNIRLTCHEIMFILKIPFLLIHEIYSFTSDFQKKVVFYCHILNDLPGL